MGVAYPWFQVPFRSLVPHLFRRVGIPGTRSFFEVRVYPRRYTRYLPSPREWRPPQWLVHFLLECFLVQYVYVMVKCPFLGLVVLVTLPPAAWFTGRSAQNGGLQTPLPGDICKLHHHGMSAGDECMSTNSHITSFPDNSA